MVGFAASNSVTSGPLFDYTWNEPVNIFDGSTSFGSVSPVSDVTFVMLPRLFFTFLTC